MVVDRQTFHKSISTEKSEINSQHSVKYENQSSQEEQQNKLEIEIIQNENVLTILSRVIYCQKDFELDM